MMKLVEERSFNSHGRRLVLGLLNFCNSRMVTVMCDVSKDNVLGTAQQ